MTDWPAAVDRALTKQNDLLQVTRQLAGVMSQPALDRRVQAIERLWAQIGFGLRDLETCQRDLQGLDRRAVLSHPDVAFHTFSRWVETAELLTRRLADRDRVFDVVRRSMDTAETPLFSDTPVDTNEGLLEYVYGGLHRLANPDTQSRDARDLGCYADIPMTLIGFERLMEAAHRILQALGRVDTARFLDVGCGGGTKVFAALRYVDQADGLEYDPAYVINARQSLEHLAPGKCRVHQADALTFDGYGQYNVFYFYRPLRDNDLLAQMEQRIFASAPPYSLVVAPYDKQLRHRHGIKCARIEGPIFLTGATQEEADILQQEARRTRAGVLPRSRHFDYDTGFWAPILDAAVIDPRFA